MGWVGHSYIFGRVITVAFRWLYPSKKQNCCVHHRPIIATQNDKLTLQECLEIGRTAKVRLIF